MQQKSHRFSAYQFLSAALPPCSQVSKSYQMEKPYAVKCRDEGFCDYICNLKAKKLMYTAIHHILRDCERSRVATYSRICKHRIILSGWYTCGFNLMFCCEIERERTLDWYIVRLLFPNDGSCSCHFFHQLGARGIPFFL